MILKEHFWIQNKLSCSIETWSICANIEMYWYHYCLSINWQTDKTHPPAYLSIYLPTYYLHIYQLTYLLTHLSTYLSICLPIYLLTYLRTYLSPCPFIYLLPALQPFCYLLVYFPTTCLSTYILISLPNHLPKCKLRSTYKISYHPVANMYLELDTFQIHMFCWMRDIFSCGFISFVDDNVVCMNKLNLLDRKWPFRVFLFPVRLL